MATISLTAPATYTQTLPAAAVAPSTTSVFDLKEFAPLIREIVASRIIDEPMYQQDITSARSFFTGDRLIQIDQLLGNLRFGQQILVPIKKNQNPFSLYQKQSIAYDAVDSCHDQIQLSCTVPCINTLPEFDELTFRFDTEYAYGVRACDKNKDFWPFDFFTEQYAKSRAAEQFGREVDLWNTVIRGLIATPATTIDVKLAATHPTHYWASLGSIATNGRAAITEAYWYMVTNFAGVNPTIFMAAEAATELVRTVENPYNLNKNTQIVRTFKDWDVPGFMIDEAVRDILGSAPYVVIMKRSPWMTYSTTTTGENPVTTYTTNFPLWSADATKQYVAILDPRVGYQFAKEGYHLVINPYDCDKLVRGMIDTEYVGSGLTFPMYGMILEFNPYTYV